MRNLAQKSIPLLISKLTSAIATSTRNRDLGTTIQRREDIKYELSQRGEAAIPPLIDLLRRGDAETATHAAAVLGQIAAPSAIIPLAHILAEPYPPYTKRSASKALRAINTPEAMLAVNIWQGRQDSVREQILTYMQEDKASDALQERLNQLAVRHNVAPRRVAEAYLLMTTDQSLSSDAQQRLNALRLSPNECALVESIQQDKAE